MISDLDGGDMIKEENGSTNSFGNTPEMKKCSEPSDETNICSSSSSRSPSATSNNSTSTPTEGPIDEGDAKGFDQKSYHSRLPSEPFRNITTNHGGDAKIQFETFTQRDSPFYNVSKGTVGQKILKSPGEKTREIK